MRQIVVLVIATLALATTCLAGPSPTAGPAPTGALRIVAGAAGRGGRTYLTVEYAGTPVAGVQLDIQLPVGVTIVRGTDGRLLCEVNVQIGKPDTAFVVHDVDDGQQLRVIVFSSTDTVNDPIPNGWLFGCTADISSLVAEGDYALGCSGADASPGLPPSGDIPIPEWQPECIDGTLTVKDSAWSCSGDTDGNGAVTISELVQAVRHALDGCH